MNNPENGLKILARMIAEAYLEELSRNPGLPNSAEALKEEPCPLKK